jgi:hypothetical protein
MSSGDDIDFTVLELYLERTKPRVFIAGVDTRLEIELIAMPRANDMNIIL